MTQISCSLSFFLLAHEVTTTTRPKDDTSLRRHVPTHRTCLLRRTSLQPLTTWRALSSTPCNVHTYRICKFLLQLNTSAHTPYNYRRPWRVMAFHHPFVCLRTRTLPYGSIIARHPAARHPAPPSWTLSPSSQRFSAYDRTHVFLYSIYHHTYPRVHVSTIQPPSTTLMCRHTR